jgi:hypothetical protein
VTDAFYLPLGAARFLPTEHTSGPWTPDAQHFGPPSALLVRALEEIPAEREMMLGRVTVEILGPAPLRELTLTAHLERPGRSVEYLSAELATDERVVARASAWRLAASDTTEVSVGLAKPPSAPEGCPPVEWPSAWGGGYLHAVEWRSISGNVSEPGSAAVWARQRVALVDGEKPSPLQRLFAIADSGSGVSGRLDPTQWWFINSELTVHLQCLPSGEWIGLDATTTIGPNGVGTARSTLHDADGQVATGAQALLVRAR